MSVDQMRWAACIFLAVSGCSVGISAAQQPATSVAPAAPATRWMLSRLRMNLTLEEYLKILRDDFYRFDADVDGKLTEQDVSLHALMQANRARTFSSHTVMSNDLDGDGAVTADEIWRMRAYETRLLFAQAASPPKNYNGMTLEQLGKSIESSVRAIMALDANRDGRITYDEAVKMYGPEVITEANNLSDDARAALMLNGPVYTTIDATTFLAACEFLFKRVDADNDGKISQQEWIASRKLLEDTMTPPQ